MRIVVLEGSPNRHGSSNMLADEFIRGAKEAGHTVKVIDAAHADLHPCTGCGTPAMTRRSGYPERAYEFGRRLRD